MTNEVIALTNEVVSVEETVAAAAETLEESIPEKISEGQQAWNQILTWLSDKGIDLALNVAIAAVMLLVGWLVIKIIVGATGKVLTRNGKQNTLFTSFIKSVISKTCWAVLIVMVLSRLGLNVGPIIAGLGVTGFILGFAFQESLGNLASGLMIAINEPFKIGDYVIVAGNEGTVTKVDMMATVLATVDNKKVVIPNKSAWGAPIVNFSALGKRRVDLQVAIGYTADLDKALKIAVEAIKAVPGVLPDPAPCVSVDALSDGRVTLNVRPWSTCDDYWTIYDASYRAVKAALEKNGINIPIPAVAVHTK